MFSKTLEKETFKQTVKENVKTLYRKTVEEATPQQIFQAVSYAVKDVILTTGSQRRKRTTRRTQRQFTTCPWSF